MELTEILNWVFGGTSLVGIATTVIFWSKSKRKEEAETQKSESEAEPMMEIKRKEFRNLINPIRHGKMQQNLIINSKLLQS